MPKEYEYHEGKKAQEDFEEGMKALFQVPKDAAEGNRKNARRELKTIGKPLILRTSTQFFRLRSLRRVDSLQVHERHLFGL
jgi:hypothetical protein